MTMLAQRLKYLWGVGRRADRRGKNIDSLRLRERVSTLSGAWESTYKTEWRMEDLVDCNVVDHAALAESDSADNFDDLVQRRIRRTVHGDDRTLRCRTFISDRRRILPNDAVGEVRQMYLLERLCLYDMARSRL